MSASEISTGSASAIGGCPFAPAASGNIATEDLVYMLERGGIETGTSLKALIDTNRWIEELAHPVPMVVKAGVSPVALESEPHTRLIRGANSMRDSDFKRGPLPMSLAKHDTRSKGKREHLLDAAATLVLDRGAANLTLQSLCEATSISRGGLLHYFSSKSALLQALLDRLAEQFVSQVEQGTADDSRDAPSLARSYLRTVAHIGELPKHQQICKALIAICVAYPESTKQVQARLKRVSGTSETRGAESVESLHLRLVADGLWLSDLFDCQDISRELRAALLKELDTPGHHHDDPVH